MATKSFPIFSNILFLLSTYSNSLKLLNTESKIKFNHDDFEDVDKKVLNYNLPINNYSDINLEDLQKSAKVLEKVVNNEVNL